MLLILVLEPGKYGGEIKIKKETIWLKKFNTLPRIYHRKNEKLKSPPKREEKETENNHFTGCTEII